MRVCSVIVSVVVSAVLLATLSHAGFGQPFSDVQGPHWASEAIAKLAADGVIQGYPDGTFRGDRPMTRDEMAVVVARLLARLEKIRTAVGQTSVPAPEVTRDDIDLIQALIDELRRELADREVRLPSVEETLNALKSKVYNVKVFGATEMRYDISHLASGAPLKGNPLAGTTSAGATPSGNLAREVFRLGFDGSVTDQLHFIAVLITAGLVGTGSSTGFVAFNSADFGFNNTGNHFLTTIDDAFLDWKLPFGLEVWLGRFGGAPPGTTYPVQFGPFGLLMNTAGDTWEDATFDSGFNSADGLRVALHLPDVADLQFQAVAIRITGNTGALSYPSGEDAYGADLNAQIVPGLRLGVNYAANSIAQSGSSAFTQPDGAVSFLYHVYGPGGGSVNPVTPNCPLAVAASGPVGITCPAVGNGFGGYLQWDAIKGIHIDAEWAQWTDGVLGGTDTGYALVVTWSVGDLLKIGHNLTVTTGYQYYGPNFYPPYGAAELDLFGWDVVYPGNAQGFTATLSFNPFDDIDLQLYGNYVAGNNVSNSMNLSEYEVGAIYTLSKNATIRVLYRDLTMGGVDQQNTYRAQVDYTF